MKRSTWILLAVVAALLAAILLWERKAPTTGERDAAKLKVFDAALAKANELERRGQVPLHLKKGGEDRWSLTAPVADLADRNAVEGFLERLVQARALRFPATGTSAAELGLDTPRATWTLRGEGEPVLVEVGSRAPFGEGLYLRVNGTLSLVPEDLESLFLRPADDYRLKALTAAATQEIRSFAVEENGKPRLSARRDPKGGWEITAPFEDWGDSGKIEQVLDDLSLCLVDSFEPAGLDRSAAGLAPPLRRVRLEMEKGPVVEIALGGPVPGDSSPKSLIYASVSGRPSPMTVSANSLKTLARDPETLRSLKLFKHDAWEATELAVRGARSLSLKRNKDGSWQIPGAAPVKPGSDLGGLPEALSGIEGQQPARWQGPSTPHFGHTEITFTLKGEGFEENLEVGVDREGQRLVHPQGRSVALRVSAEGWAKVDAALKVAAGEKPSPGSGSEAKIP